MFTVPRGGVNIAARLQGLAHPGGVCVSARVQEDVAGKLDVTFEDQQTVAGGLDDPSVMGGDPRIAWRVNLLAYVLT